MKPRLDFTGVFFGAAITVGAIICGLALFGLVTIVARLG